MKEKKIVSTVAGRWDAGGEFAAGSELSRRVHGTLFMHFFGYFLDFFHETNYFFPLIKELRT